MDQMIKTLKYLLLVSDYNNFYLVKVFLIYYFKRK